MNKKKWGIGAASTLGLVIVFHFATLPPAPPEIPPVPSEIKIPPLDNHKNSGRKCPHIGRIGKNDLPTFVR